MFIWPVIAIMSCLAAAALFLSTRALGGASGVSASGDAMAANENHFRQRLAGIDQDIVAGKLDAEQADIAKAELAKELVSFRAIKPSENVSDAAFQSDQQFAGRWLKIAGVLAPILAVAIYVGVGNPSLPAVPLAQREAAQITFEDAIAQIEEQMERDPSDIRGWQVLGPAYLRVERFEDAVNAFQHVVDLSPRSADTLTNLAEARLMANRGVLDSEIEELLTEATLLDATHIRSRFFLAAEATRTQDWENAAQIWEELLGLSQGGENWVEGARRGLALAQARGIPIDDQQTDLPAEQGDTSAIPPNQQQMIMEMVEGLHIRLYDQGGSIEEWTRLVRSRLVLEQNSDAQDAYNEAVKAYPNSPDRTELDAMAQAAGLVLEGN